jgi:cation transport ATPase
MGGSPQTVWVERSTGAEPSMEQGIEMKIPFDELRTGDILVANRGEFIPVNGLVTSGEATLNLLLLTRSGTPMTVATGDRVYRGAFVTEGRLRITVDPLQAE